MLGVVDTDALPLAEPSSQSEDTQQPTMEENFIAVNKCTASINTPNDHFGGLREEVPLL